jgi:hypothetical protein
MLIVPLVKQKRNKETKIIMRQILKAKNYDKQIYTSEYTDEVFHTLWSIAKNAHVINNEA